MSLLYHLIPGYTLYDLNRSIISDKPFTVKVVDAVVAGAVSGSNFIFTTHYAQKIMNATGTTSGYLANRWQTIAFAARNAVPIVSAYGIITSQLAAGEHIAAGGAKGHDLYTAPQRRRVSEIGFSGYSPHYRAV